MQEPTPQITLEVVFFELRHLVKAINELKEEYKGHLSHCRTDMESMWNEIKVLREAKAGHEAEARLLDAQRKTKPHWHIATGTYLLGLFTFLLAIDILLRLMSHVKG